MTSLNLQLNSEAFFSSIDLNSGISPALMTASNTWKLNILAGFTSSASFATQDIEYNQAGGAPKRSLERYNVAVESVGWGLKTYIRPTGVLTSSSANTFAINTSLTGNVKPVADWFLWQALISNTAPANDTTEQSVWRDDGVLLANNTLSSGASHASRSNFVTPSESYLYIKLDNVVYQVSNAVVDSVAVDAGIEEIATVYWTGYGTDMRELIDEPRDNAVSVFGGVLNNGSTVGANATIDSFNTPLSYHPFSSMYVGDSASNNAFIKNRLSALQLTHTYPGEETSTTYIFSVTSLSFSYNNNISYLRAQESAKLNRPKKAITNVREVFGSATMYLRTGNAESVRFLNSIRDDTRISSSEGSSAKLLIGGPTAPFLSIELSAVHFDFPQITTDTIIAINVDFYAQNDSIKIQSVNTTLDNIVKLISEQGFVMLTEDSYEVEL